MKKTLALLLTLCIVLALGACGAGDDPASVETAPGESASGENPEALHVGFSIVSLEFPFYVSMLDGFKAACAEKGWTYEYTDAGQMCIRDRCYSLRPPADRQTSCCTPQLLWF